MMRPGPGLQVTFLALGPVELQVPNGDAADAILKRPKLLALFSYLLAATPSGFHRRDTLMGLFWAELDQKRARGALRQSVYHLRQSLGDGVVVARGDEEVGIAPHRVWGDVAAFEDALARGAREESLEIYRGDFLDGFFVAGAPEFERWLEERREELRRRARQAAWELAEQTCAAANVAAAAHWARRTLRLARYDEEVLRQVISLLDRVGDRAGAVREYEVFARRLREDLDVEPAPETQALVDDVRSRGVGVAGVGGPGTAHDALPPTSAAPPSTPAAPGRVSSRRPFMLISGGVAAIATAVAIGTVALRSGGETTDNSRTVVVAVFENLTGEPGLDPVGRMAADWITQGLDQLSIIEAVPSMRGLMPRPDFSAEEDAGSDDVMALARATGAGTVVSGTYYLNGDSLGFQAQVVEARTGRLLSAVQPVVGHRDGVGALVDTLRQFVVGTVARVFDSRVTPSQDRPPTIEAYRTYLAGYRAFHRIPQQMREALTYLHEAVELDSAFLDPRFMIVFASLNIGDYAAADSNVRILAGQRARMTEGQGHMLDWQSALVRGDRAAALAAARAGFGPLNAGVEALRSNHLREAVDALSGVAEPTGSLYQWLALLEANHMLGEYDRELSEAERAWREDPEQSAILDARLRALAALGRIDEVGSGLDGAPRAGRGGPSASTLTLNIAAELRAHGHRQASFEAADRVIEWYRSRQPTDAAAVGRAPVPDRGNLASAYYLRERWDDAEDVFQRLALEAPDNLDWMGFLGVLAARKGDEATARQISDDLTGRAAPGDFGRDLYWQACIASLLGQRERAMELLREAYDRGRVFGVLLHRDMDLEYLRDYPPFQQFLRSR